MKRDVPENLLNIIVISSVLLVLLVAVSGMALAANAWVGGWNTIGDQNDATNGLINPLSIAVTNGNVTVTSPNVEPIANLRNGGTWRNLGTWDSSYGSTHVGVAMDVHGDVYVLNPGIGTSGGTSGMVYEFVNNTYATNQGWLDITNPYDTSNPLYPPQQFYNSRDIASNEGGAIYVINMAVISGQDHYEIIENEPIGGFNHDEPWYRIGLDVISNPTAIATDGSGDLYVLSADGGIVKGHPSNYPSYTCTWSFFSQSPKGSGIAVDNQGNVYVADPANKSIDVLPYGSTTWVSMYDGSPNTFIQPTGVAVDSLRSTSKIYVADYAGGDTTYKVVEHQAFPSQLVWTTQPGGAYTGANLNPQPVLKLEDVNGNVETGDSADQVTVTLTGASGATLSGTTTVTMSSGVATFSDLNVNNAGSYTLTATCGHLASQSNSFTIMNIPIPSVTGIGPSIGPTAGGTSVTVTGNNFTGATAVRFGSTAASSFIVNSATSITAVSPAGSVGIVDVTVTTPYGTSAASSVDQFTYGLYPVKNLRTGYLYRTIQSAIDDVYTTGGDTILVGSGVYKERVNVYKALNLTGNDTGSGLPVVDGYGGSSITINVDGVTIHGFNATNASSGIVVSSSHNNITGNIVFNNTYDGIDAYYAYNNISGNTVNDNSYEGIYLNTDAHDNNVTGNTANGNGYANIYLYNASHNNVTGNTANDGKGDGILLQGSPDHNTILGNTADNNGDAGILNYGPDNDFTGNEADGNTYGIYIGNSGNDLTGNNASSNTQHGITLSTADHTNVTANTVNNNIQSGIYIDTSNSNNVTGNMVNGNLNGINLQDSTGNVLWLNAIANNAANATVSGIGVNHWNSTAPVSYNYAGGVFTNYTGNYWGDYRGPDANGDGIGDVSRPIVTDSPDYYPMLIRSVGSNYPPALNGMQGTVVGRVTAYGSGYAGVAGAYVAIVNASNVLEEYANTTSDAYGNYNFTGVNATYSSVNHVGPHGQSGSDFILGTSMYRIYANKAPIGDGYSNAFGIDANNSGATYTSVIIFNAPEVYPPSSYPPALNDSRGNVVGRVTSSINGSVGIAGAYVAIVNASNALEEYANTTTDANGYYNFTGVNASYSSSRQVGPHGQTGEDYLDGINAYRIYANKSPYGEGWSSAFGVDADVKSTTYTGVFIEVMPARVDIHADRDYVSADGNDNITLTFHAYDAFGNPVINGFLFNLTVGNATNNAWNGGFPWTVNNGSLGVAGQRDVILASDNNTGGDSVKFGWADISAGGGYSTIWVYSDFNASIVSKVGIYIDAPIQANFTANTTNGTEPQAIQFRDTSAGNPTNWSWDFGDSSTSSLKDPVHLYSKPGLYTVTLNASDPYGSSVLARTDYINVTAPVITTFSYTLPAGWSMISTPLALSDDMVQHLPLALRSNLTDMWYYDQGTWLYYSGTNGFSPNYGHLCNITPGKGYWVNLAHPTNFTLSGVLTAGGAPSVGSGWTMFGLRGMDSINATVPYPNSQDMWYYDQGTWIYYSGVRGYSPHYGHLVTLEAGKGYWVHV